LAFAQFQAIFAQFLHNFCTIQNQKQPALDRRNRLSVKIYKVREDGTILLEHFLNLTEKRKTHRINYDCPLQIEELPFVEISINYNSQHPALNCCHCYYDCRGTELAFVYSQKFALSKNFKNSIYLN